MVRYVAPLEVFIRRGIFKVQAVRNYSKKVKVSEVYFRSRKRAIFRFWHCASYQSYKISSNLKSKRISLSKLETQVHFYCQDFGRL